MLDKRIETFVRALANGKSHTGRPFFEHLKGTHDMLEHSGAREAVCLAGLCHSIYGTNAFKEASVAATEMERMDVIAMIGYEAERLAYIFCSTERPLAFIEAAERGEPYRMVNRRDGRSFDLSPTDLHDLLQIEAANLSEQGSLAMLPRVISALERI
jgi:hypothetical protein